MQITQSDGLVWRDSTVVRIKCGDRADKAPRGCPFCAAVATSIYQIPLQADGCPPPLSPTNTSPRRQPRRPCPSWPRSLDTGGPGGSCPCCSCRGCQCLRLLERRRRRRWLRQPPSWIGGESGGDRPPGSLARATPTARPDRRRELRQPHARIAGEICANLPPASSPRRREARSTMNKMVADVRVQ